MAELLEKKKVDGNSARISKKVLFVQNIPYDTKDDEFEKAFSDIGPIRKCFLIKEKEGTRRCRGFGYVTFAFEDDAQKAKETVTSLKGRHIRVNFSEKKPRLKRALKKDTKEDNDLKDDDEADGDSDDVKDNENDEQKLDANHNKDSQIEKKKKPKSARSQPVTDAGRTVLLFGLPSSLSSKELYKRCRKIGEIEKTVFPVEGKDEPIAALTFKTPKIARTALLKLNHKTLKGNEVTAILKSKENRQEKQSKKSRVIVRNLSFKCTEGLLREVFAPYDNKLDVHVPMDTKYQRNKGFGFVQFTSVFIAAKAVKEMNMKEVLGRKIIVDWAVSKEQYADFIQKANSENNKFETKDENATDSKQQPTANDDDDDDHDGNNSDPSDHSDVDSNHGDDGGAGSHSDQGDSEVENDEEEEENVKSAKNPSDVKEGLTIFIRNINYDSTEKSLYKMFKKYGEVSYCKLVTDPITEHSKGTAFVKFKSLESVQTCLTDSIDKNVLVLDGHKLQVDKAVTRGKALQLRQQEKDSKKEPKDKRNLYLAREGVITQGTEAAKDLTKADLLKRQKAEAEKKKKLQNPNCFISTTRLCVRNLPLNLSEFELKKVFSTAGSGSSKEPTVVKKVMIMRSKERVDSTGKGRSLGFGFIEFTNHKDALTALRSTNNNPEVFGPNRRPIVEFSIENSLALKAREQRLNRSKFKQTKLDHDGKTNKQLRIERVTKRREKRRETRKKKSSQKTLDGNEEHHVQKQVGKDIRTNPKENLSSKRTKATKNQTNLKAKSFDNERKQDGLKGKKPVSPRFSAFSGKRNMKHKRQDFKEEKEFNSIVQKYKSKFFGENGSTSKRARWFE